MKNLSNVFLFLILILFNSYIYAVERQLEENETLITENMTSVDIQKIIDEAQDADILLFDIGSYKVNLIISKSLILKGVETAHVVLTQNDVAPVLSITNTNGVTIQNFTFGETATGINVGSSTVVIQNNIFTVGDEGTAIQADELSLIQVKNNTFNNTKTAIEILNFEKSFETKNNIFSGLTDVGSLFFNLFPDSVSYNCFDEDVLNYSDSGFNKVTNDIAFVENDDALKDNNFQLKTGSICIDSGEGFFDQDGSRTDIGAYGGEEADQFSFPIENIVVTRKDSISVDIKWDKNEDYRLEGYKIYYDKIKLKGRSEDIVRADLKQTLITADSEVLTTVITNLETNLDNFPIPDAPELVNVEPRSNKLIVNWKKSEGALSYEVFYREGDNSLVESIPLGNVDNTEITGLIDGVNYTVWVTSASELQYYFQVVGYLEAIGDEKAVEGLFINSDSVYVVGSKDSIASLTKTVAPEAVEAYPKLPNEGCFIATAAFGFYSHQQVQVLRDFRDNYLLTNAYGTAFVDWYYEYGPSAATLINEVEILKPIVRVMLWPLIIVAQILAYNAILFWLMVLGVIVMISLMTKKLSGKGLEKC